ncbi:DNA topoisomerase II medium subunit [Xanthomonas phage X1]|nr:DNA topoisomerase II medium subunit [Xanthomonas phage X1]
MRFFEDDSNFETTPANQSGVTKLRVKDFLDRDFKSFSEYDCQINIPNMIDGFKISQRKAAYVINRTNKLNTVERYSAQVASETAYHHGAGNLEGVIVGMAQNFPTSNNVNWFVPDGTFGNILDHKASSGRYISVEGSPNFRKWFSKDDDLILEYEFEDGEQIEPTFFIPKVPTILFNGSSGIGTGYSSTILNYNPDDVVRNVLQVVNGKKQTKLVPWYRGWTGDISKADGQTTFRGKFERVNTTTILITELPVGVEQEKYQSHLSKLIDKGWIKDYDDDSTEEAGWKITLYTTREWLKAQTDEDLMVKLGLISRESENIVVWDHKGKIKTFDNPEQLVEYFVEARLEFYEKRRQKLIEATSEKIRWLSERMRFILFYLDNSATFKNLKKDALVELLQKNKFADYDRLLQMPIWNLTKDKIEELSKATDNEKSTLVALEKDTAKDMYVRELKEIK